MAERLIEMGAIASAHGIRGQFKVKAFCDDPMDITAYGPLQLEDGRSLAIKAHSHAKGFVLCSAKEVTSRNQAESLRGKLLFVTREDLPEADDNEIYHADLIDYQVKARGIGLVGKVIGIFDFGAGTVIEIKRPKQKPVMVPFGDSYHPEVDDKAMVLEMDIAPDWLDDAKPQDKADKTKADKTKADKTRGK